MTNDEQVSKADTPYYAAAEFRSSNNKADNLSQANNLSQHNRRAVIPRQKLLN